MGKYWLFIGWIKSTEHQTPSRSTCWVSSMPEMKKWIKTCHCFCPSKSWLSYKTNCNRIIGTTPIKKIRSSSSYPNTNQIQITPAKSRSFTKFDFVERKSKFLKHETSFNKLYSHFVEVSVYRSSRLLWKQTQIKAKFTF